MSVLKERIGSFLVHAFQTSSKILLYYYFFIKTTLSLNFILKN